MWLLNNGTLYATSHPSTYVLITAEPCPCFGQTMPHYIDIATLSNFYELLQEQEVNFIFLIKWKITATKTFGLLDGTYEEMPYQDLVCLNDVQ